MLLITKIEIIYDCLITFTIFSFKSPFYMRKTCKNKIVYFLLNTIRQFFG